MAVKNLNRGPITTFTLEEDVSIANAIRRTIINDIPTWVFITSPHEKNQATFHTNTTRMNNELLKQRLSCIPIHSKYGFEDSFSLEDCYLEVNVENTTDTVMQVTTEHFIIKKKKDNEPISIDVNRAIFPPYLPPDNVDEYFILFINLRPRISDEIPGEKIHFVCNFSVSTARESAMFNVTSMCTYGNTLDEEKISQVLDKKIHEWKEGGMSKSDIDDEVANWRLLDAKRIYKDNSFDFSIQSIGVFDNNELLFLANKILRDRITKLSDSIGAGDVSIIPSLSTMENAFDITFIDDYTVGKPLEYMLYKHYFNEKVLAYCGYIKLHPHDDKSIIRIAYHPAYPTANISIEHVVNILIDCLSRLEDMFVVIGNAFSEKSRK